VGGGGLAALNPLALVVVVVVVVALVKSGVIDGKG